MSGVALGRAGTGIAIAADRGVKETCIASVEPVLSAVELTLSTEEIGELSAPYAPHSVLGHQ